MFTVLCYTDIAYILSNINESMVFTMNLYIKQRIFSWGDSFSIYDSDGNERYHVEGEVFTFGKKLHLYDLDGTEIAYIEQEVFTFLPKYYIYIKDKLYGEVVREFTLFSNEYTVNGPDWNVRGDFFCHDYDIYEGDSVIASVQKEWFTLGDAYEISISSIADEIAALTVVLVIDACIEKK